MPGMNAVALAAVGVKPITTINEFVIRLANVNGSGSATANQMLAKSILRMGVPVVTRNIFPSNIQGLPTWFDIRVSEKGFLGARDGGADFMVAMNPQTWDKDVGALRPGGYLFYDSTRPIPRSRFREDINVLGLPLTAITNAAYIDARQRQLMKNMIYVGALAALLDIEPASVEQLIGEQFKAKPKLIQPNIEAFHRGIEAAREMFECPLPLRVRRADEVGDRIVIDGNSAMGLGAVYGGASVCAWYPITPSTSVAEAYQRYASRYRVDPETGKNRFAFVQAEDELAAIGMVVGAGWNGARAFTATSGPGVSLMQEFLGLAYFAEIPVVLVNVQRGGPSTGMPTRTQQSDVLLCAYASHGDTKHVLLFPEDPYECFEFGSQAFDLADRLQTPIFVMLDLDIGMNERLCKPFKWDDSRSLDRGKVVTAEDLEAGRPFARYMDVDGDGIGWRTYPGTHPSKGAYFTRGTSHNARAAYSEESADYIESMERLLRKFDTAKSLVPAPVRRDAARPTKLGVIYYGSTSAAMDEALVELAASGIALDALRVRAFPFNDEVQRFVEDHDQVYVVEQNRDGQLRSLLILECEIDPKKLVKTVHYDGTPISAHFIATAISTHVKSSPIENAA